MAKKAELQAENETLREELRREWDALRADNERLRAENVRLLEALEAILAQSEVTEPLDNKKAAWGALGGIHARALVALRGASTDMTGT